MMLVSPEISGEELSHEIHLVEIRGGAGGLCSGERSLLSGRGAGGSRAGSSPDEMLSCDREPRSGGRYIAWGVSPRIRMRNKRGSRGAATEISG